MDSPVFRGCPPVLLDTPAERVYHISMEPQHTITVAARHIPTTSHVRVIPSGVPRPAFYSELTGPESAFDILEGVQFDTVRVIAPELVTIQTFQTL